jgi:hypothetical protein
VLLEFTIVLLAPAHTVPYKHGEDPFEYTIFILQMRDDIEPSALLLKGSLGHARACFWKEPLILVAHLMSAAVTLLIGQYLGVVGSVFPTYMRNIEPQDAFGRLQRALLIPMRHPSSLRGEIAAHQRWEEITTNSERKLDACGLDDLVQSHCTAQAIEGLHSPLRFVFILLGREAIVPLLVIEGSLQEKVVDDHQDFICHDHYGLLFPQTDFQPLKRLPERRQRLVRRPGTVRTVGSWHAMPLLNHQ